MLLHWSLQAQDTTPTATSAEDTLYWEAQGISAGFALTDTACMRRKSLAAPRAQHRHVYYVITVGASRPVRCFMLDSRSATFTSGAKQDVYYVITVGASRPVRCFMLDSRSATSTSGASAVAASACRRSGPASGATYCSTYMRMVAPDEPVPAHRSSKVFDMP